jgi:hypothetical protein
MISPHRDDPKRLQRLSRILGYLGAASLGSAVGSPLLFGQLGNLASLLCAVVLVVGWHLGWSTEEQRTRKRRWFMVVVGSAIVYGAACFFPHGSWLDSRAPWCLSFGVPGHAAVAVPVLAVFGGSLGAGAALILDFRARAFLHLSSDEDAVDRLCMSAARWCLVPALLWSFQDILPAYYASSQGSPDCVARTGWIGCIGYTVAAVLSGIALSRRWARRRRLSLIVRGDDHEWELVSTAAPAASGELLIRGDRSNLGGGSRPAHWSALRRRIPHDVEEATEAPYRHTDEKLVFVSRFADELLAQRAAIASCCMIGCICLLGLQTVSSCLTTASFTGRETFGACRCERSDYHFDLGLDVRPTRLF